MILEDEKNVLRSIKVTLGLSSLPTNLSVESKEGRIRKRKKDRQTDPLEIFPASRVYK